VGTLTGPPGLGVEGWSASLAPAAALRHRREHHLLPHGAAGPRGITGRSGSMRTPLMRRSPPSQTPRI